VTILLLLDANNYFILVIVAIIYIYYISTKVTEYRVAKKHKSKFEVRPTRPAPCDCDADQLEEVPKLVAKDSGVCHYDTQIDRDADDMSAFHARNHRYETRSIVSSAKRKEMLKSFLGDEFQESEDKMHFAGSTYF
jgi:hypothetical protein